MPETTNVSGAPLATPPAAQPPKPPVPQKPAVPPKTPVKTPKGRRSFLFALFGSWIAIAWLALTASVVGMLLGTVRFLFPNVLSEPPSKVTVGFPGDFPDDKVTDDFKDKNIWVVKHGGILYALSTTCTHLGCTPNWLEREQKFKCPCHGSGFYKDGINFEGPAPRPLERSAIRLADDGQIEIDKSKIFQEEIGQWSDPSSFVPV
jgi:cytochrome b6-f complex iron-sulfur subunit